MNNIFYWNVALLPNTAALTSSIGFTVMNYQAVPKANQMSVPTSNKFRWPSHIFSLLYRFNRLIALLFFWFRNLQLLQVCMTHRNFAVWQGHLVVECSATNGHAPRHCLVPSIAKKGRLDKPNLFS